jgi:endogenous inhibitor of DNA gyrase (YacG/DUF329 family)
MTCPICDNKTDKTYRPFCSRRCADIDLGRWMLGSYAVPAEPAEPSEPNPADSPDPGIRRH